MRIISLLPSATEIVCQLGLESSLVGVSHECDYPKTVQQLPRLTRSNVHYQADSTTIHDSVESLLQSALTVYDLDMDLFEELKPDWVVTQDLCDVCAVSLPQVEEACNKFSGANTKIISLRPGKLNDIWEDVKRVSETLGGDFGIVGVHILAVQNNVQQFFNAVRLERQRFLAVADQSY